MAEAEKKVAAGQGEGGPQEAEGCGPEAGREKEVGTGNRGRRSQKAEERDTREKENETGWGAMGGEGSRGQ